MVCERCSDRSARTDSAIRVPVCYPHIPLDDLTAYAAHIGLKGVDLLNPDQYEVPRRYGLICTMGYAGGGQIAQGLNRLENHAAIESGFRKNIPLAAKAGVPNVITFSGNRAGLSDEQGAKNTVIGLNQVKKIAEDHGVTICMELLNSKVNHKDYMCDHTAWGVDVVQRVNSPNVKLLYDIYHMQIMEGDLIDTIQQNIQWIGHFHTGGVPGRHELNDQQEVQWTESCAESSRRIFTDMWRTSLSRTAIPTPRCCRPRICVMSKLICGEGNAAGVAREENRSCQSSSSVRDSMQAQMLVHRIQNAIGGRFDRPVQGAAAGIFMPAAPKLLGYRGDANRALAA